MSLDPVFDAKRDAMLEIIKARDCNDANYIYANGWDYASMLTMLFAFGSIFDCENTYLDQVFAPWDDADLLAQNVYYNKPSLVDQDNIIYAANSIVSNDSHLNIGGFVPGMTLTYNSHIEHLFIDNTTELDYLIVAAGSSIKDITIEDGSKINHVLIKTCDPAHPSSIGSIQGEYGDMAGDEGSLYGGDYCVLSLPL